MSKARSFAPEEENRGWKTTAVHTRTECMMNKLSNKLKSPRTEFVSESHAYDPRSVIVTGNFVYVYEERKKQTTIAPSAMIISATTTEVKTLTPSILKDTEYCCSWRLTPRLRGMSVQVCQF
jgi:hypothetical protein